MAVQQVFGGGPAWVADLDPGAARVLDHHFSQVPNLGDITALDWRDVAPVDVLTGGYPCQPFSVAGRRKGTADERHIWPYIADALRVLRPRVAVFENVAGHLRLGFSDVLADLAALGFNAEWTTVRASDVGAPHQRERLFILAAAQDADGPVGHQWGVAAPGQAESRRARPDAGGRGGAPVADAAGDGHGNARPPRERRVAAAAVAGGHPVDADANRVGLEEQQRGEPGMGARGDADGRGPERWGRFAPGIARWEAVTGLRAPWATDDRGRLSPAFVEWMMGLDPGHVTAVPGLSRNAQLKALGNGVVPLQAARALTVLRRRIADAAHPYRQAA
nr:DNA cytosine methyltransferase [Streptomyces sp. SID8381]